MDSHFRTLGTLYIVFGVLNLLLLVWGVYIFELFQSAFPQEAEALVAIMAAKVLIGSLVVTFAILYIFTGWGLINKKNWSQILALVMGIVSLGLFPLGTALGLYSIIVFLMAQSPNYNPELRDERDSAELVKERDSSGNSETQNASEATE